MEDPAVRVLLVDDDENEHIFVSKLLGAACAGKFELTWVASYAQCLEAVQASRWDVCLLDYRLGRRSGLDLLAEVTAIANHPPVILMTGMGDRDVDLAATKAGAADYLVKGELTASLLERSIRYAMERERTLAAIRARDLAQSLNVAKGAFLATMSHEIRTPMNAILGMADMLWESPLNPDQRQYVEVFRRAGAGLLVLINDILDLSKIEAGHLELERIAFDPEEVVDQAVELTAVEARTKGVALMSHFLPGATTLMMGDPARLRQILINLLGNAVKFTSVGEVVLTVRRQDLESTSIVEFAITDTGIGIPPDKRETIFEDFSQADASTTPIYGGTGLGLGLSRRLVESMGGTLTVTSAAGHGSTFTFTIQADRVPENARKVQVAPPDWFGKRVLLIGGNATGCLILRETLLAWGLQSVTFASPAEALAGLAGAMAGEHPYSLAILDGDMPGMNGFECAAEIRRIAGSLPTVMLTSDTTPGDLTRRANAGLSGYAVKPLSRTQLLSLIDQALKAPEGMERTPYLSAEVTKREPVEPARILVGEDSPDNRMLVQVYLKDSPYALTFEEDGRAVVNRFASSDFDLILMDIRMPVMDGLAATVAIRALEKRRGALPIPIIALTAGASSQDILNTASAGCDTHVSKPVSKVELLSAIEKCRRPRGLTEITQTESPGPLMIEMPPGLERIVPVYLARRKEEVPDMIALLGASDFARLAELSHDLKGSGTSYGFPELTRLGAALEQSAQQGDGVITGELVAELGHYLMRVELVAEGATN